VTDTLTGRGGDSGCLSASRAGVSARRPAIIPTAPAESGYNRAMLAAAKVLRWALVGLYDETTLLFKANLVWFLLTLPLGLPLVLAVLLLMPHGSGEGEPVGFVLAMLVSGLLLLIIPNPASLGVYRLAATIQGKESPPLRQFLDATRQNLRLGLGLYVTGLMGLMLLGVAASFYLRAEPAALQALSVLYLYLVLFWLALQLYLGPLAMLLGERRPLALYRRAALLVLAHPIYSLTFLLAFALLTLLCFIALPLFPALAMSFVALVGTGALADLKRRYDPQPDPDEGAA
jgi:hypothetical protein